MQNDTDEDRVVLLFDFERPMTLRGRLLGRTMLALMRRSRYVRDSKRQYLEWEERFQEILAAADDEGD